MYRLEKQGLRKHHQVVTRKRVFSLVVDKF